MAQIQCTPGKVGVLLGNHYAVGKPYRVLIRGLHTVPGITANLRKRLAEPGVVQHLLRSGSGGGNHHRYLPALCCASRAYLIVATTRYSCMLVQRPCVSTPCVST